MPSALGCPKCLCRLTLSSPPPAVSRCWLSRSPQLSGDQTVAWHLSRRIHTHPGPRWRHGAARSPAASACPSPARPSRREGSRRWPGHNNIMIWSSSYGCLLGGEEECEVVHVAELLRQLRLLYQPQQPGGPALLQMLDDASDRGLNDHILCTVQCQSSHTVATNN